MIVKYLLLLCFIASVSSYNILGVFPHLGKSHFDAFQPLMIKLSEIGHTVTVISYFPIKPTIPRYTDIDLTGKTHALLPSIIDMDMLINQTRLFKYFGVMPLVGLAETVCDTLNSSKLQSFLKADLKFDVVLTEMFTSDCYLGVVHKMNAPFIGISSSVIMPWENDRFGNPENPAYIPVMMMDFSDQMGFFDRVENTISLILNKIIFKTMFDIPADKAVRKYLGGSIPSVEEIARNASLFLVNSHFSLSRPRPLVPSVIEVGGMHIKKKKSLAKNIEKFITDSPHGVIYFSMGSMVKAQSFPDDKRDAFLNAFAKLKQRVLWKWENDSLPGKPDNVMIQKWMPQFDILCHSNVVAFISHGGLLGTTEAVHCGVPMIVMPQFGDQFTNAKAIEANNGGVILEFDQVTEETVSNALNTVLEPSFFLKAKDLSAAYNDRPLPPLDTAIYWVEYVARHKGARFMRSAAVDMPLYQYLLLDVIVFISVILIIFISMVWFCLKTTKNLLFSTSTKEKLH